MNRRTRRAYLVYEVVRRHRRGESKRGISRALGIARDTVDRILDDEATRRVEGDSALERELPKPRAPRATKLDPYLELIESWLATYTKPKPITAQRIFEKLREETDYDGSYTTVRQHVKKLRAAETTAEAVTVVETPPGQQSQFDWSPYVLPGCEIKVQMWSCVLSWSRGRSFEATNNTQQTTIFRCLIASFESYGGVPLECVTDSMPGIVDRWECNLPILNVRAVDIAAYYNFAYHIAPRGDGAYKGKVERPFRYFEDNLLGGRKFSSVEDFLDVLSWWVRERALRRPHPRTGRPIADMILEERPYLQPLPAHPYDARDVVFRVVESTAFVRYETNFYAVPETYIGQLVYLVVGADRLEIVDRGVHRIADYERIPDGAGTFTDPHPKNRRRHRYDIELLLARFAAWGPSAETFARRLQQQKRQAGPELAYLLGLQLTWSADTIVAAIEHATRYDAYSARAIERILEARFSPRTLTEQIADSSRDRIRKVMKDHPVTARDLRSYDVLRTGNGCSSSPPPKELDDDE